jgi:hypothetical protein
MLVDRRLPRPDFIVPAESTMSSLAPMPQLAWKHLTKNAL